jgi:hypothetical protein
MVDGSALKKGLQTYILEIAVVSQPGTEVPNLMIEVPPCFVMTFEEERPLKIV